MAGSIPDEDESVLTLTEQTRRPLDTAYRQQRIPSWNPYLDPVWVIGAFLALSIIFIPVGWKITDLSDSVVERKIEYDAHDDPNPLCGIGTAANAERLCNISFVAPKDMSPPVLIHYEIDNFHQNHRRYKESLDLQQLAGSNPEDPVAQCDPLGRLNGTTLNPCGLIANTLFNDIISLTSGTEPDGVTPLVMLETGIAWQSDIEYLYNQPDGFFFETCPNNTCDASCCAGTTEDGNPWSCAESGPYQDNDGDCFRFFYPKEETTQYLYETYPKVVNPIEGVLNEHFIVWMRIAALPKFRKLYGWINQPIAAGTELVFEIEANWEVTSFDGSKSLIVSTNNVFGGQNDWLGRYCFIFGIFCLGVAVLFSIKHVWKPRKVADKRYLRYKEE